LCRNRTFDAKTKPLQVTFQQRHERMCLFVGCPYSGIDCYRAAACHTPITGAEENETLRANVRLARNVQCAKRESERREPCSRSLKIRCTGSLSPKSS
jgi:hypothetical protein